MKASAQLIFTGLLSLFEIYFDKLGDELYDILEILSANLDNCEVKLFIYMGIILLLVSGIAQS